MWADSAGFKGEARSLGAALVRTASTHVAPTAPTMAIDPGMRPLCTTGGIVSGAAIGSTNDEPLTTMRCGSEHLRRR